MPQAALRELLALAGSKGEAEIHRADGERHGLRAGRKRSAETPAVPAQLPQEELARLTTETASPAGRIGHLKPVVQLSETPPFWARPPVPLGHHRPQWP